MKVKRRLLAFFFSVLMIWQGFFFAKAEGEDFAVSVSTEMLSSEREEIENPDLMNGDDRNREAEDISSSKGIESNERDLDEEKRSLDEGYIEEDGMQGGAILPEENALPAEENNVQAVRADHAIIKEEPALFSKEPVNGKIQKVKDTVGADHYLLEYVIRFNAKKYSAKLDEYNAFEVQDILNVGTESGGHRLKFFDPKILNSGFIVDNPEKYMPSYRRGVWRSGRYTKDSSGKELFEAAEDDREHRGPFYELLDNAEELDPDNQIPADSNLWYNTWNDDATEFRNTYYNFSSQGGFELRYFVEIDEIPVNGAKYTNKAKLYDVNNDSTLADIDSGYTVTDKSGSFQNDGVKIVIKKTDREGKALEGAEFLLYRENASFEMEVRSNKDGIAEFPRLLQRDYKIEEMNPPEGYFLDRSVYEVKKELFNTNSTVLLTIANDRLDSDHRNIIVEKRWLLEPHCPPGGDIMPPPPKAFRPRSSFMFENSFSEDANEEINGLDDTEEKTESQLENIVADAVDSEVPEDQSEEEWNRQGEEPSEEVTIILLANGQEVKRVTLSRNPDMDKNYRHIFENLPRKDENGLEIVYTIKEEAKEDSGYQSIISGTADTKFTITNYHKNADLIPISVTKIWEGTGPHPNRLAVYLYENDQVISKFTLSARNDWQHIFLVPAYKLQDSSIRYEVREAALKDYEGKRVSGEDGRTFVFTNKKKPKPPVPDTEDNPPDVPHNPPDNPGGGGGTPPNSPGGGRPPRVIENPPAYGTTPPPTTPDAPGEVLGTKRSTPKSNEETQQVLSAGREPKVLGQGRGWTKTSDSSAMRIYLVLFLLSLIGLPCSYIYSRRKIRNK